MQFHQSSDSQKTECATLNLRVTTRFPGGRQHVSKQSWSDFDWRKSPRKISKGLAKLQSNKQKHKHKQTHCIQSESVCNNDHNSSVMCLFEIGDYVLLPCYIKARQQNTYVILKLSPYVTPCGGIYEFCLDSECKQIMLLIVYLDCTCL